MTAPFSKLALSYEQQLQLLESRGLGVPDRPFAIHCLRHLNYYRLSPYRFPLTESGNPDRFRTGITFAQLWALYDFDQTLRRHVLDAAKRVEVSVRSHWAYVMGLKYGPFCYEDSAIFEKADEHLRCLAKVYTDLASSKEDFVKHFRDKYGLTRPPVWAVCEVLSFGQMSRLFQNLKTPLDRKAIAAPFGIDEKIFVSFLNYLTVVRNTAAHHARLWDRRFSVKFVLPHKPAKLKASLHDDPAADGRIYNTITMLLHLLEVIEPNCRVGPSIYRTIDAFDAIYHPHMGMPPDWKDRPLWKAAAAST